MADKGSQQGTTTKPQANPYLTGSFLFVSVDPDGKSAPVNLLQTTNEVHPRTIRAAPWTLGSEITPPCAGRKTHVCAR
jgi:hypothetical protein